MSAVVAIATREIRERWVVLAAAVAFAILPFIIAALPFAGKGAEKIGMLTSVLSAGLTIGVGVALGSSIVGRDLTSGKLSFYFARPLGAASIWFGKLAAALVLIVGTFAISFLPILVVRKAWTETWNVDLVAFSATLLGVAVVLFLVAHAISTAIRSRSLLIAADFVLAVAALSILGAIIWPLLQAFAMISVITIVVFSLATGVLAVVPAGLWQLARGRADRVRSHAAMSTFLWAAVAVVLICAAASSYWLRSATPDDLDNLWFTERASTGNAVLLSGQAKHHLDFRPLFIADPFSGTYVEGTRSHAFRSSEVSADGSTMVSLRPTNVLAFVLSMPFNGGRSAKGEKSSMEFIVTPSMRPQDGESLAPAAIDDQVFLSADGSRAAIATKENLVSVYDTRVRRLLYAGKLALPPSSRIRVRFVSPDLLRIFTWETHNEPAAFEVAVHELAVGARALTALPSIPVFASGVAIDQFASGDVLVRSLMRGAYPLPADAPARIRVIEPRSGITRRAVRPLGAEDGLGSAKVLRDGSIVVSDNSDARSLVRIIPPDGAPERQFEVPTGKYVRIAAELGDGSIVGMTTTPDMKPTLDPTRTATTFRLTRDGQLTLQKGIVPIFSSWWSSESRIAGTVVPCLDRTSHVVLWDVAKNSVTPVVWKKR